MELNSLTFLAVVLAMATPLMSRVILEIILRIKARRG